MREILRGRPRHRIISADERRDDVQPFTPGGLAKRFETDLLQTVAHFEGSCHHGRELYVRGGIQIEHEAPRHLGVSFYAIPRVQFKRTDLRNCG